MNTMNLNKDIIAFMASGYNRYAVPLYRSDAECEILKDFIGPGSKTPVEIIQEDLSINEIITRCQACGNAAGKKIGFGTGKNRVMIILNAPRLINAGERTLFKSESVDLLKKMMHAVSIVFNDCYITNLLKCDVDFSIAQPSEVMKSCMAILQKELSAIDPAVVIVMGDMLPLQQVVKSSKNIFWFNIEHPITLIKNPELKRPAWNTLKIIREKLNEL